MAAASWNTLCPLLRDPKTACQWCSISTASRGHSSIKVHRIDFSIDFLGLTVTSQYFSRFYITVQIPESKSSTDRVCTAASKSMRRLASLAVKDIAVVWRLLLPHFWLQVRCSSRRQMAAASGKAATGMNSCLRESRPS